MEEMIKLSALCVALCLLSTLIGQGSKTMSLVVLAACGMVLLGFGIEKAAEMAEKIKALFSSSGIDISLAAPVMKVLGIALCGKLTAELCRDMGSRWAASNIEIFAVIASVICMLPLLEEVLRLVGSI